ncbi:MAG: hypothetical protein JWN02_291 [Acidobacteria bacterium]|nr:hypothetical protein [Acidobacteriota bacterium]
MKRLLLSSLFILAFLALAVPSFACAHCNFNDECVDDSSPETSCYISGTACLDRLCYAPGDVQPMLSEYSVQAVTVAHGPSNRQVEQVTPLQARLDGEAAAPARAR